MIVIDSLNNKKSKSQQKSGLKKGTSSERIF